MVSFSFRPENSTLKIRTSRQKKNSPSNVLRIRVFSLSHSDSRVSQWRFVTSSNVFCFCSAITEITFQHLKSHEIHYYSLTRFGSISYNVKSNLVRLSRENPLHKFGPLIRLSFWAPLCFFRFESDVIVIFRF